MPASGSPAPPCTSWIPTTTPAPIVAQIKVAVAADDRVEDLEERVKVAERDLVVNTLRDLVNGTIKAI